MFIGRDLGFQMSQSNIAGRHSYVKTVWLNSHTQKKMSDLDNNNNDFDITAMKKRISSIVEFTVSPPESMSTWILRT